MARRNYKARGGRQSSYDEESRARFGSGNGWFGFGDGGGGLPWVFAFVLLALLLMAGRLVYVQVIQGPHLAELASQRRSNVIKLQARRGTIYDRNGNVLAMSESCYDVYCNPQVIQEPAQMAEIVAGWLGGDESEYRDLMEQESTFVYLVRHADQEACESMRAELADEKLEGIELIEQMKRVYPFGPVCGQILGMVDVDGAGISGIELAYDDVLGGTDGSRNIETGLNGIPIADAAAEVVEPKNGKDITLSIDINVQKYVEEHVEEAVEENKASSGFCMVCDPHTGEILASCSTPYADLTDPGSIENEALNLKMVSSSYDPGSIFKILTAAIGVESGTVDTSTYLSVPGFVLVGKDYVQDDDGRWETMDMNLREVLRRSSNVGAVLFARELIGPEVFAKGVESFGIGQLTGIDYPGEVQGIVRSLGEYDPSTLGSMSFGQGLTIPMVQMVRAVSAIANEGRMPTPHFATSIGGKQTEWPEQAEAVSASTAEKVADMMRTVVEEGTGTSAAVEGFDVAAKTGTGEQAKNGTYVKGKYLASLIGFAPATNPEVLVYVGLNETPYISYSSAGPVFSAIMGEVLEDTGVLSTQGL